MTDLIVDEDDIDMPLPPLILAAYALRAADIIEQAGHCKHNLWSGAEITLRGDGNPWETYGGGSVCAAGALFLAAGLTERPVAWALAEALADEDPVVDLPAVIELQLSRWMQRSDAAHLEDKSPGAAYKSLVAFNDHPATTPQDVVILLRRLAQRIENRHPELFARDDTDLLVGV